MADDGDGVDSEQISRRTRSLRSRRDEVKVAHYRNLFIAMALTMSWQLAIVVIVPIVGGHALDDRYHSWPWFTVAGFAAAGLLMFGVMIKTVHEANKIAEEQPKGER